MISVNNPFDRSALVPLVLRLALATIFIYAGLDKVTPTGNLWGAKWMGRLRDREQTVPREIQKELQALTTSASLPSDEGTEETADGKRNAKTDGKAQGKTDGKSQDEGPKGKVTPAQRQQIVEETAAKIGLSYMRAAQERQREDQLHYGLQIAVAWGELAGGVAILLGLLTRWAALGLMIIQIGAIYMLTGARGFTGTGGGYEYNFALLAMCLALVIAGGGFFSLDRFWLDRRQHQPGPGTPTPERSVLSTP